MAKQACRFAIVSAADDGYFRLLQGLIFSIRDKPQGGQITIHVFDIGLTVEQIHWLAIRNISVRRVEWEFGREVPNHIKAFIERSRLPYYFPGHDYYLWMDADAWVQRWSAIEVYIAGTEKYGFSIAEECDRSYDIRQVVGAHHVSFVEFGDSFAAQLPFKAPLNVGVFAGAHDAPHWQRWREDIALRLNNIVDLFLFDQTALTFTLDHAGLPYARLGADFNWVCCHRLPAITADGKTLTRPGFPFEPLGIVHATAGTKHGFWRLACIDGGFLTRELTYQASSTITVGDYVSENLAVIRLDRAFPDMAVASPSENKWEFLRRDLPHNWYVDTTAPDIGFVNRDEAHILYNTALSFRGRRALEIGCHMGWSAAHLLAAGVDLDIIDPALRQPERLHKVQSSIRQVNPGGRVSYFPEFSPVATRQAAALHAPWSLIFIDGDHSPGAPLADAMECEQHAADDAAILLHDLASPAVAEALTFLNRRGWNTAIYHTAQIMGIAWRGAFTPIEHKPDPGVRWTLPRHLERFFEPASPRMAEMA